MMYPRTGSRLLLLVIGGLSLLTMPAQAAVPDAPQMMAQQNDGALALALSPDGNNLVTGSLSGELTVWDLASKKMIRKLGGHNQVISALAFSPDGRQVLSVSRDYRFLVHDLASGELALRLSDPGAIYALAVSPDGKTAASGRKDGLISLWDLAAGKRLQILGGPGGAIMALAWSADGKCLLSGVTDGSLQLWDVASGSLVRTITDHGGAVSAVAFSPDGQTLYSGSFDQTLQAHDRKTGRLSFRATGHGNSIESLVVSPDGGTLLSSAADHTLRLWSSLDGKALRTINLEKRDSRLPSVREIGSGVDIKRGNTRSAVFSPDGLAIFCTVEGNVRAYEPKTGKPSGRLAGLVGQWVEMHSLALSPDDRYLFVARGSNVMQWDLQTLALTQVLWQGSLAINS